MHSPGVEENPQELGTWGSSPFSVYTGSVKAAVHPPAPKAVPLRSAIGR